MNVNNESPASRSASDCISRSLGIPVRSVLSTLKLFDQDATIPFIARYRKELTGGLDEVQLLALFDAYQRFKALEKRRTTILDSLRRQGVSTPEIEQAISNADSLTLLEDIYLPYRPRRRTRADQAREKGLEQPAAEVLNDPSRGLEEIVASHAARLEISKDECLAGIADIIAGDCAVDANLRGKLRALFQRQSAIESRRGKNTDQANTYLDYFEWREPVRSCPSHRLLAILRGESTGALRVTVCPPSPAAIRLVEEFLFQRAATLDGPRRGLLRRIASDAYGRLLAPALETEIRKELRERAEVEATSIFAANLYDLLMAAPLGPRAVLAIDPGFRTGSKVVLLDGNGRVRDHRTIFPVPPRSDQENAARNLREMAALLPPVAIAVGSGTGGREVERFVRSLRLENDTGKELPVVFVNEAGASVYSASKQAREELPELDVSVRGAVSIGRRLQDPLSELVKIDPAAVGVGQYQHDIDTKRLKTALDRTVERCVNTVGVELNTAGTSLLARVAGLGTTTASSLVAWRESHGSFPTRTAILEVPGIGPRVAEQAMGFLRCRNGIHPLDNTAIHPERYDLVEKMAADLGCSTADLCANEKLIAVVDPERYTDDGGDDGAGILTVKDILRELRTPGRDPRDDFEPPAFRKDVNSIDDLTEGMKLAGVVTNVTGFGAFVDIGVHRDGLIHISRLSEKFVRDPREVVRAGQRVEVVVLLVDRERGRINLCNITGEESPVKDNRSDVN